MTAFNLGNFGNQLQLDELNGALGNAGGGFQFSPAAAAEQAAGGIQAPTAPTAAPQATDSEVPGQPQGEKKQGGIGSILGLVGSFMGGTYGAALQGVGGMMGGKK